MLKYQFVSLSLRGQQANLNRQQAKMIFQFACRKWLSHKDLEPAGPVKLALGVCLLAFLPGVAQRRPRTN